MRRDFMCVMVNGGSLSDAGRTVLLQTAHKMWQKRCTEQKIENNLFPRGKVTTDLKHTCVVDFEGVMFKAMLIDGRNLLTVGFMVGMEKLEEPEFQGGHWHTKPLFSPMGNPELN